MNTSKDDISKRNSYISQITAVCIKNTLLVTFGMTLGYPTILIPGLKEFEANTELISWIGSINLICVPVGCTVSGMITQLYGRKRIMQLVNIPFLCAWLLFKFSTDTTQILIASCMTGLTGGLLEAPVITYVVEICQPKLRGMLASTSTLSVIGGILIEFLFGIVFSWRTAALANCFFPVLSFILLFAVPESPHWLILKNRDEEAKKSIAWLRGWTKVKNIEQEYKELKQYVSTEAQEKKFEEHIKLFLKKSFLWPFSIVSLSFFLGHFSGMSTLQTFSVHIFASLKAPINKYLATVCLGAAELLGCLLCVALIHKLGKRIINFISMIGCSICFVIVGIYGYLIDVKHLQISLLNNATVNILPNSTSPENDELHARYNWIPLVFLISAALLSHMGIRILPWILTGELYSNETRATGSGISSAVGYIFGFLANKTFLYFVGGLTLPGTFWLNGVIAFGGFVLLYVFLPETEGKPLHEITLHFRGDIKLDNSVKKKKRGIDLEGIANRGFSMNEGVANKEQALNENVKWSIDNAVSHL